MRGFRDRNRAMDGTNDGLYHYKGKERGSRGFPGQVDLIERMNE